VLDVFAVLGDEGRGELDEGAPELGEELGPHKVLDWLLLLGLGVDVDIKLLWAACLVVCHKPGRER
jgi:hypothetical protein